MDPITTLFPSVAIDGTPVDIGALTMSIQTVSDALNGEVPPELRGDVPEDFRRAVREGHKVLCAVLDNVARHEPDCEGVRHVRWNEPGTAPLPTAEEFRSMLRICDVGLKRAVDKVHDEDAPMELREYARAMGVMYSTVGFTVCHLYNAIDAAVGGLCDCPACTGEGEGCTDGGADPEAN